jgi:hypothetical protein
MLSRKLPDGNRAQQPDAGELKAAFLDDAAQKWAIHINSKKANILEKLSERRMLRRQTNCTINRYFLVQLLSCHRL